MDTNDTKQAAPFFMEPLSEELSLKELIREINAERAVRKANHLAPAVLWSDIERLCNGTIEP